MKVYILNPPFGADFCRSARWAAKSRGRVQRHPDWILTAAAVLEQNGHEVKFLDGAALNSAPEEVIASIKQFQPNMTVIHTTTPSIDNDIWYASEVKRLTSSMTILVGPHVTAVPQDTLQRANDSVDALALGEYDYTLRELADGNPISRTPGLAYIEGDAVKFTKQWPFLDVRELPFPAWKCIDPRWYHDAGKKYPFITLLSGRGCFGKCTFCRDPKLMEGRRLRFREPAQVVDEMEYDLKLFPFLREIMFETDTFTAVPKHVQGVCEEILRRSLKISWSCNARVDMKLELLPLMKRAGCRMLMVGFEFGYQEGLDAVRKGTTLEQSQRLAEAASRLGLTIHGCFMFGAPGETPATAQKTIDFSCSLPLDTVQYSGVSAYPGTEFYDWAKTNGYLLPNDWREWLNESLEQVTVLNYPQLSKEEIDKLIDKGLKSFYLRPKQMWRMLKAIHSMGDVLRKFYGLKSFLNYFATNNGKEEVELKQPKALANQFLCNSLVQRKIVKK